MIFCVCCEKKKGMLITFFFSEASEVVNKWNMDLILTQTVAKSFGAYTCF